MITHRPYRAARRLTLALAASAALPLLLNAAPPAAPPQANPYAEHIAPTEALSPAQELKLLRVPPGFEVQLVAAEPAIHKPLNLNFDARGRLWVSETVEYPFAAPPGKGHDAVKVLEDIGADGRARKVNTFADGLNIPIGILPLRDGALSFSIPNVLRLRDTDGDGRADRREVLYSGYGFIDTHGMTNDFTRGFDGWVYACHGFANTSTVKAEDGGSITMNSGNTYRMKDDGSHIEQITWGQVNPFGLCFDPLGNLYSCDCHSQPVYQLLRGAYYPSFGKPDDGLGFGPEMTGNYTDSTAIAGIAYYAAEQFPEPYRGGLFIGDVVTHRVNLFRPEWHGSSPWTAKQDFLLSDDPWFRPVDVKLGPDGALYVADFYNRIIGHYEVPLNHPGRDRRSGRIWRIVYRGPDGKGRPPAPPRDLTKEGVKELVQDLGNANLTVRFQAAEQLIERGGRDGIDRVRAVVGASANPYQVMHGLWVLERRHGLDDWTLEEAAHDRDAGVRVHAMRVLAERPALSPALQGLAGAALKDGNPFVQRAAAEALGRHPSPANLRPLLDLRHAVPPADTHLLHVVRMALRDNLRPASAWDHLPVAPWTEPDARAVADVAVGVPSAEAAAYLLAHLRRLPEEGARLAHYVHHVARYGSPKAEKALLVLARGLRPDDLGQQAALCRAVEQGTQERGAPLGEAARAWAAELTGKLLASPKAEEVKRGIELAGSYKLTGLQPRVVKLLEDRAAAEEVRSAALWSVAGLGGPERDAVIGRVLTDASAPFKLRELAAYLLAGTNQPAALARLVEALPSAPAALQTVIAEAMIRSREGIDRLLEAIAAGKASPRLLQEPVVEPELSRKNIPGLMARVADLTRGLPPADQRMKDLLRARRTGYQAARADPALGAKVFEKSCATCHQLAGKGAKVGPQLDGIGTRGLDRLLEDVLDPNRNVDQAFRLTTLSLKSGQVVAGLLLREEGEVLVLADSQGKDVRVPKKSVEERTVSPLSPMPANFADQLPEREFYDLMAYLLKQQPTAKP
jgi:putative heme-binding domain-containing protein